MSRSFSTAYGNSDKRFGHKDYYEAKRQGASDQEILSWLDRNTHLLGPGNRKGGKGGLHDQIASAAAASVAHSNSNNQELTDLKAAAKLHDQKIADYDKRITDYDKKILDKDTEISGYKIKVEDLTGKYEDALSTSNQYAKERDDYQKQFREASDKYEQEKLTADRYREESVNYQLQGMRAGATAGGGNQTSQMTGSLSSGKTGYSSDENKVSDLAESMKGQGGLTDSVLSRGGSVVQQLNTGRRGPAAGGQRQMQSSAGTGSYYASRFR